MADAEAWRAWRRRFEVLVRAVLRPRSRLSLSAWAEAHRYLAGVSATRGRYRFDQVPYLREVHDTITDPAVEKVVIRKASRMGVTEGPILNGIGYFVHQDPSGILVALPTVDDAKTFSKSFLSPMLEATPVLRELMPEAKGRDGANTILTKSFAGYFLELLGTNSPRMVRMRSARALFADEVDAMAISSGKEGDFLDLFYTRADNYADRKIVISSSPSWVGVSRIDREFLDSDQRHFYLACPRCGLLQELQFGGRDTAYGLKWPAGLPRQAFYLCEGGCKIYDHEKPAMYAAGYEWRAHNPGHRTAGFHMGRLISLFPGAEWPRLAERFVKVNKNAEQLQVFVNTVLGESYEDAGERVAKGSLLARREDYGAEVPMGVGVLTAGVDIQRDRVEVLVNGWGAEEECWRICHVVIPGDFEDGDTQEALRAVLLRSYQHAAGVPLRIRCAMVDSGDQATAVYAFVKPLQRRRIFASKGDRQDLKAPIVVRAKKPIDAGVKLATIGTFNAKRHLFSSLRRKRPGPRYKHFGKVDPELEYLDVRFFEQYENEKLIVGKDSRGRPRLHYEQVGPNEAIDLEVGALAALRALGPAVYERLARLAERVENRGAKVAAGGGDDGADGDADDGAEAPGLEPVEAPAPRRRGPRRGGYMNSWRNG